MHDHEYRARTQALQPSGPTPGDLRGQVGRLGADKGFDVALEQRPAYPTSGVLKLSSGANAGVGTTGPEEVRSVKEGLGMAVYGVLRNLLGLADPAGVDPDEAFEKKDRQNADREW